MTENDVKTVLKVVLADQKKTTAYLKKLFVYSPKESDAIDAEQRNWTRLAWLDYLVKPFNAFRAHWM